jgi:hypothetical protein
MAHPPPPSFAEEDGVELVVLELSVELLEEALAELDVALDELDDEPLGDPSEEPLAAFFPPSRKSVTYQPLPFRIKPVRLSSFTRGPL